MISFNALPQREEFLKKKRRKKLLKYGLVLLVFIVVTGALSYVSHRKELTISKVELTGGILVTQEDVEARALEYIQGSYLWIFPVRNAFLYPKGMLRDYLKETFKRIDTINISLKNFHTLSIEITERKPVATWCRKGGEDGVDTCYFIDQNSTIFALSPNFSGDAYFKYYGLVEDDNPLGSFYISSTTKFIEISNFVSAVKKLSLSPQYLLAKGNDEFSLVIAGGGEIYFDTKTPLSTVAENLEALLKTPALSTSSSHTLPVEYVDLRYGNKLFYKLKSQ